MRLLPVAALSCALACSSPLPCPSGVHCGGICVDPTSDPVNCGACGNVCADSEICRGGMCVAGGSFFCADGGWHCGDACAGITCPADHVCDQGHCVCGAGLHSCGGSCVRDDAVETCGQRCTPCPQALNATPSCESGQCKLSCLAGTHACHGQCRYDSDPTACGADCVTCPSPPSDAGLVAACVNGECAQSCRAGLHACDGGCVVENDQSCGSACAPCAQGPVNSIASCVAGACAYECLAHQVLCGSTCLPETGETCGPACMRCPTEANADTTCTQGACGTVCRTGFQHCAGACVPEDAAHCGSTCLSCQAAGVNSTAFCDAGVCASACNDGFHDCGSGCVAETPQSCGKACTVCPAPPLDGGMRCASGSCVATCQTGQHVCGNHCEAVGISSCGPACESCPDLGPHSETTCKPAGCDPLCAPGYLRCSRGCCRATGVFAGDMVTCAALDDGTASCWGTASTTGLGDGHHVASRNPVSLPGVDGGVEGMALFIDSPHCALLADRSAMCWGAFFCGIATQPTPTLVPTLPPAVMLKGDAFEVCLLEGPGSINCVDAGIPCGTTALALSEPAIDFDVHNGHGCAALRSGAVECWGSNAYGQVGNGTKSPSDLPTVVIGWDGGAVRVATGDVSSCALSDAGTVACWGSNGLGELGNPAFTEATSALMVPGLSGVTDLCIGAAFMCAVHDRTVSCWGQNTLGQLGDGTHVDRNVPVPVLGLDAGVRRIACGSNHACVLTVDGAIKCWGAGAEGELSDVSGDGATAQDVVGR